MTSLPPTGLLTPQAPVLNADQARAAHADRHIALQVLAGAGAGKTLLIGQRFLHLLAELRAQGVDDPQTRILAVTFTIDAAAEMRTRIQKYLGAERLDDEAAICNFHRFCNTLLQRHALAMGLPPGFRILQGLELRLLMTRLQDSLHHGDYSDIETILTHCDLKNDVAQDVLSLEAMRTLPAPSIAELISELPGLLGAIKATGLSPKQFHEMAHAQTRRLNDALRTLPQVGMDGTFLGDCQHYAALWDTKLRPWTAPGGGFEGSEADRDAFMEARLRKVRSARPDDFEPYYQDRLKWLSQWKAQGEFGALMPFVRRHSGKMMRDATDLSAIGRIGADESRLIDWAAAAYALYQETLRQAGACDFDDLINHTLTLLDRRPDILASVRRQFEAVIVDEFQDSNGSQLALLRRLIRPEAPALTVVGDLKQSIYRFRYARPDNMERAFQGLEKVCVTLRENYRSEWPILAVANALAQQITGDESQRLESGLPRDDQAPRAQWVELASCDPLHAKEPAASYYDRQARWIAAEAARLIADAAAEPKEITVLVKSHHKGEGVARALADLGIPSLKRKNAGFFEEPVIRDAMALLRLLRTPSDNAAWTRILQKKLSQRQLLQLGSRSLSPKRSLYEALNALSDASCWPELDMTVRRALLSLVEELRFARAMMRRSDPAAAFTRLAQAIGLIDAEAPASQQDDARMSLNAFRRLLYQLARQQPQAGGVPTTIDEILITLESAREDASLEIAADTQTIQGDAVNAVSIMTIHGAKGLENEVVFVAYAHEKPKSSRSPLLRFDPLNAETPRDDGYGLILGKHPASGEADRATLKKKMYRARWEAPQAEAEEKRLFYVAVTRARRRLIVVRSDQSCAWTAAEAFSQEVRESAMTILSEAEDPQAVTRQIPQGEAAQALKARVAIRLEMPARPQPASVVDESAVTPTSGTSSPSPDASLEVDLAEAPPVRLSFSALRTLAQCPVRYWLSHTCGLPEPPPEAASPQATGLQGIPHQAIGHVVHALIERHYGLRGKPMEAAQRDALLSAALGSREFNAPDDEARARANALFDAFLESPFTWDALAAQSLRPQAEVRLRFHWPSRGCLVEATLDALLYDTRSQQPARILEFKTNRALDDDKRRIYAQQLALYREGLLASGQSDARLADDYLTLVHLTPHGVQPIAIDDVLRDPAQSVSPLRMLAESAQAIETESECAPLRPERVDCAALGCPYQRVCPRAKRI